MGCKRFSWGITKSYTKKNKLLKRIKNEKGATLIYILASFMMISFIGATMIKQSHHEVTSSADFSSMSTAEEAARSGIEATEKFFNGNSAVTVTMLNNYLTTPQTYPVLGDAANKETLNSNLSFYTELLSFYYSPYPANDFVVTVKSYGFGRSDSRATITSTIRLNGLEWGTASVTDWDNVSAFSIGDGLNIDYHSGGTFHGATYFSKNINFDGYATMLFDGPFRCGTNVSASGTVRFTSGTNSPILTFNDVAYFNCNLDLDAKMTFNFLGKLGIEGNISFENGATGATSFNCNNNVYKNGNWDASWSGFDFVEGNNNYYYYKAGGSAPTNITIQNFNTYTPISPSINIPDSLGISQRVCEINIDESVVDAIAADWEDVCGGNTDAVLNGTLANQIYNNRFADDEGNPYEWHGFAVVKADRTIYMDDDGTTFTGKLILLANGHSIELSSGGSKRMFSTTTSAANNLTLIANGGGAIEYLTGFNPIRGLFLCKSGSSMKIGSGISGGSTGFKEFHGAIQIQAGSVNCEVYTNDDDCDVWWDPTVLDDLNHDDFIKLRNPDGTECTLVSTTSTTNLLVLSGAAIEPTLLSMQF